MELGLKGRRALVAGASRGIGKACALALAGEDAVVGICARDPAALEEARDEIAGETRATVVAIPADVSTEEGATGFVRRGIEALGGCEILVANAGGPPVGRFEELSDEAFEKTLDETFFSTLRMTREALPSMRASGYGRVVVIASLAVKQPIPGLILSNSIRAAVIGWARTLAGEVARDGITVNAVLPGRIATDAVHRLVEEQAARTGRTIAEEAVAEAQSIPLGRFGEAKEVADLVAFLCSERAAYLTGCFVQVDGGLYRGLL